MHPKIREQTPGTCPICGMQLVPQNQGDTSAAASHPPQKTFLAQYKPLFVIVGLIVLAAFVSAWDAPAGPLDVRAFMQHWMAGFFLVFSGFKLLNVSGFAEGYAKYDLLAKQWHGYGFVYPFLELGLGIAYLQIPESTALNAFTVVLMLFSGVGVAIKLAKREKFQCACLGTVIDVPLTKVTLVEDFGMALMAALMLAVA